MSPRDIEVFTHNVPENNRLSTHLVGTCPWCCRIHKFKVWREVTRDRATTISGKSVSLPKARQMVLGLSGRVMTPEAHRLPCEGVSAGLRLIVRDAPLSTYRRPITKERPEDWNRWLRLSPVTDEPPF
jgi:hypothetical protein